MLDSFFGNGKKKRIIKKETCYFSSLGCRNPALFEVLFKNGDTPKKYKICAAHKDSYDKFRNGESLNLRNWNEFILREAKKQNI